MDDFTNPKAKPKVSTYKGNKISPKDRRQAKTQIGLETLKINKTGNVSVPLSNLYVGSKKKIYNLLKTYDGSNLWDIIKGYQNTQDLIVHYSSTKSAIENFDSLRKTLDAIFDVAKAICYSLIESGKTIAGDTDNNLGTYLRNVINYIERMGNYFKTNKPGSDSFEDIKKFVKGIDDITNIIAAGVQFKDITNYTDVYEPFTLGVLGLYKQIYTLAYEFLLVHNVHSRQIINARGGRKKLVYAVGDNGAAVEKKDVTHKTITTRVVQNKEEVLAYWISSRWNWRLGICTIDKIIFCAKGGTAFKIPKVYNSVLPICKHLSSILGCGATSFLGNIDLSIIDSGEVYRVSKEIINSQGLKLGGKSTNRCYNFENINKKNTASDNISYTYFCYEGVLVADKTALINYATGGMEVDDGKENNNEHE